MTSFEAKVLSCTKAFDCSITRYSHVSKTLGGLTATLSIILPSCENPPVLYWLSGLTCTDQNFIVKAGAAKYVSINKVAIVCPDTSPRGAGAPREAESWDFGTGAGFYVNATQEGYENYKMHDYVVSELPNVVKEILGDRAQVTNCSIFGHSMGGMGALSLAFSNPGLYKSVSAFSPISNPVLCPWGKKCFRGYLGDDVEKWKLYDPTELVLTKGSMFETILIDQGSADEFLEVQLMPQNFTEACQKVGQKVDLNMAEGYDHSYFFIQTFVEKHISFHAQALYN
ncbi:S-formylglutathione hydrolase [Gracilariopsis chorda]|uniref:S-formylglutathione hydrolase n=1 Tax=Gracilariopsis chorda TaxID=448386 RepID=A0A2V3IMU2_9FLOR|nr:S-formylglutathione hydrolase [Gracilariopsis chorda]|eukprot:PXF43377.1 S-formylglutathione hydrolase [Gracilariopsis chorda]